jgi:hypothetical protein
MEILQQKISDKHTDSFWYDGEIAELITENGTILRLMVCGDVRINNKNGEIVFDCKERNDGIKGGLNNDDDLKKIGQNYDDDYYWENNNWFEVMFKTRDSECFDGDLGVVEYDYDSAIQMLKNYAKDKRF